MFPFQGTKWSSVFVNGNGNLTFGAADPDFSESVPELLAGRRALRRCGTTSIRDRRGW